MARWSGGNWGKGKIGTPWQLGDCTVTECNLIYFRGGISDA